MLSGNACFGDVANQTGHVNLLTLDFRQTLCAGRETSELRDPMAVTAGAGVIRIKSIEKTADDGDHQFFVDLQQICDRSRARPVWAASC